MRRNQPLRAERRAADPRRPSGLRLELSITAPSAMKGHPVEARVLLLNESSDKLYVNSRLLLNGAQGPHELLFRIKPVSGRKESADLPFRKKVRASFESQEFQWLRPGDMIGCIVDLVEYYSLARGAYTLVAVYRNHDDPPSESPIRVAWKGELHSEPVSLKIK